MQTKQNNSTPTWQQYRQEEKIVNITWSQYHHLVTTIWINFIKYHLIMWSKQYKCNCVIIQTILSPTFFKSTYYSEFLSVDKWTTLLTYREHFVYTRSQWETTLQCNVVSHWLGACTHNGYAITTSSLPGHGLSSQWFPHTTMIHTQFTHG